MQVYIYIACTQIWNIFRSKIARLPGSKGHPSPRLTGQDDGASPEPVGPLCGRLSMQGEAEEAGHVETQSLQWFGDQIYCVYIYISSMTELTLDSIEDFEDRWIVFRTGIDSRSQFVWTVVMTVSAGFLHLELQSSLSTGTTCFNFPWCRQESQQKHFAQQILTPSIALLLLPQKKLVAAVLEFLLGRAWECENGFNKVFWEVHWTCSL